MSPALKYTLGRLGLFVWCSPLLLPVPLNILVKAMIALLVSAGAPYFLLASGATRWPSSSARPPSAAAREGAAARRPGRRRGRGRGR